MLKYYSVENDRLLPTMPSEYHVSDAMRPEIWFKPSQVWELRGAEFTLSPVHVAAQEQLPSEISQGRGLSLRFPRFVRLREDKGIHDATTAEQVTSMFLKQGISTKPSLPSHDVNQEDDQEEEEDDQEDDQEENEEE